MSAAQVRVAAWTAAAATRSVAGDSAATAASQRALRALARPHACRVPARCFATAPPSPSFPRGPAIPSFPSGSSGSGGGGGRPGLGPWLWLGSALAAALGLVLADKAWQGSERKKAMDAAAHKKGFPLPMLLALREARATQQQADVEAAAIEAALDRRARMRARAARRQQRRQQQVREEQPDDELAVRTPRLPNPFLAPSPSDESLDDLARNTLTSAGAPSLLEAERLYKMVLSKHLAFGGLDLPSVVAMAKSGAPTPAQAAVAQGPSEAQRAKAQRALEQALAAAPGIDPAVLPFVLSMLGHNQHTQARLLRRMAEEETAEAGVESTAAASPSSLSLCSARRFRAAETSLLQSLTLYRHHFAFSPRPYAPQVLHTLGTLYADAGDAQQAEQALMHAINMLAAAGKEIGAKWTGKTKGKMDQMVAQAIRAPFAAGEDREGHEMLTALQAELASPLTLSRLARCSSEVAASLASLHRSRGRAQQAVQWDQEALEQWDRHCASERGAIQQQLKQQAQSGKASNGAGSPAPAQSALLAHALATLPHALHLLNALSADYFAAYEEEQHLNAPGPQRQQEHEKALRKGAAMAQQALQVLERIVALDHKARSIRSDSNSGNGDLNASASQPLPPLVFSSPLDDTFVQQLSSCLRAMESDALAAQVSFASASAASLVAMGPAHRRRANHPGEEGLQLARDVAVPVEPFGAMAERVREEAAAAFHNYALTAQSLDRAQASSTTPQPAAEQEAQRARQIAKQLRKRAIG